jgi:hypothetical protein
MKIFKFLFLLLGLTTFTFAEYSSQELGLVNFQVKIKPNSKIPIGKVHSNHPSNMNYNNSRSEVLYY